MGPPTKGSIHYLLQFVCLSTRAKVKRYARKTNHKNKAYI